MDTSADAYFPDPRPLPPGQRRQLWARLAIRLGIFLSLVLFLCLAGRPLLSLCMPFGPGSFGHLVDRAIAPVFATGGGTFPGA